MFKSARLPLVASAVVGVLLLASCGKGTENQDDSAKASGQTVTVATASRTELPRTVTASGTVTAWEEVPVAAETGGLVATALYVDEGSYVREGQPLVQMNDALLRAQLRQQQAQVSLAEANLERDDAALSRAQELHSRGYLAQAGLDTALADQRAAMANLAAARASLAHIQTQVNQATVRAPVSGQIISRSVTKGQIITSGTELFRLVRDGRLELDAQIPETQLPMIASGQTATITASDVAPSTGTVRIVTPQVDANSRLGVARISLSPNSGLKTGMFAKAEIDAGNQMAVTVPTSAILYRNNRAGVFVLNDNGNTVRFTPITVLNRTDATTAVDNLPEGSRVVVSGAGFLNDGDRVNVSSRGQAAPASQPATK